MGVKKDKHKNYESAMARLEEITELLENGETGLEDSIELYTEGLKIARSCDEKLSDAEAKIKLVWQKNGKLTEKLFEADE